MLVWLVNVTTDWCVCLFYKPELIAPANGGNFLDLLNTVLTSDF